ncbi:MAG: cell surface receptor domain protein [Bacteroidetes bacterium]|nr:cell surface receptor domain protein [Bacteroidota bacterium]
MKRISTLLLFTFSVFIVNAQPVINSFLPVSGAIGSTVTISGTNFGATAANNTVYFGGVKAAISAASTTSLTVTVPVGANFGSITVTNLTSHLTAYSATPYHVTFGCNAIISLSSFAPKVDFVPGSHPVGIATGDIDGDGKLDMVVTNAYDNSISVFLNTSTAGSISFAAKVDFTVGDYPYGLALGDLDGDGKLDVAVANGSSIDMSVLRNTSTIGAVSFAAKTDYPAVGEPYAVAIGDLDADGKPDIALANFSTPGYVSVFKNTSVTGTIALNAKIDFSTGGNPKSVAIYDIDRDGKPDLTLANYNSSSNSISILRNTSPTGSIAFAAKVDFTTGANPYAIAVGDLDGDSKPDIAVPNNSDNTFSIFRNTSTVGTISMAARVNYTTGSSPVTVVIDDLDGNGKLDVAVSNQFSNSVSLYENNSTTGLISFAAKVDFTTAAVPYSLAIGDLDGDQRPDLATANASANSVSTLRDLECPVGILSYDKPSSEVKIYPNPAISQITVEIAEFKKENTYEVLVYDVLGKVVLTVGVNNQLTTIDRGALPAGIYFIQVLSKKEVVANEKVIIQN